MRILANECRGKPIISWLQELGHDIISVRELRGQGSQDPEVLKTAIKENRILLTYDKHFYKQLSNVVQSGSDGVMAVRVRKHIISETKSKLTKFLKIYGKVDLSNSIAVITGNYFEIRSATGTCRYDYSLRKI